MRLRPSAFKVEIYNLIDEGYSSREIANILRANHGKDSFAPQVDRTIRDMMAKKKKLEKDKPKKVSPEIEKFLKEKGVDSETPWTHAWYKPDKEVSVFLKNPNNKLSDGIDLDEVREDFIREMSEYAPDFRKIEYSPVEDPHCLVIDIADLHIGKLATEAGTGNEYNVQLAVERARGAVKDIMRKTAGHPLNQIVFVIGNDVLHVDNLTHGTTKGTSQDVDGMWYDNFKIARSLYTSIITGLTNIAPVHVIHCPSNHDFMTGFMLADSVQGWLYNNNDVTFDVSIKYRKYFKYGRSLMMFEHGDGTPLDKLPMIMAEEAKEDWSQTDYRYIYLHHIHSNKRFKYKVSEDHPGVNIQYLRSPSGTDMWHDRKGWVGSIKAVEAFIHSIDFGQCSIITHNFR